MKTEQEKQENIQKTVYEFPELQSVFEVFEKKIQRYNFYQWQEGTTKELFIQKRDELYSLAQKLGNAELTLLYYVKKIDGLTVSSLVKMLKKLYLAQCAFKNELQNTDEFFDLMAVGASAEWKASVNHKKI